MCEKWPQNDVGVIVHLAEVPEEGLVTQHALVFVAPGRFLHTYRGKESAREGEGGS